MTKRFTPIWLVVLLLVVACGSDKHQLALLDSAETVMTTAPDTALALLDSIDSDRLSRADNARYALLRSQALDKNYIDVTNDSLINIAVEYYKKNKQNNVEALFQSYYYQGRVYENTQNSHKAMECYLMAEEIIDLFDNDYAKGLLYAHIARIYNANYDLQKALDYYQKALELYKKTDKTILQYYTLLDICAVHINLENFNDAQRIADDCLEWGINNNHNNIIYTCFNLLYTINRYCNNIEKLKNLQNNPFFKSKSKETWTSLLQAYISAEEDNLTETNTYINQAWYNAQDMNDTVNILYSEYIIKKRFLDYKSALSSFEEVVNIQDSIVRHTLQQPLITIQRDYYQSQAENRALQLNSTRQQQLVLCLVILAILMAVAIIYIKIRGNIAEKNAKIAHYINVSLELQRDIYAKESALNEMSSQIKTLFKRQFDLIDNLSKTFYENPSPSKSKESIYLHVKHDIELLSSDEAHLRKIEEIVNTYKENVMAIAREALPLLSNVDFHFLCLFYAGFSAKAISVFTGNTTQNIYSRKSRLKSQIEKLDPSISSLLLKHLQ